jgi:3-methyladenine DNA glycosylase AlkC
MSKSPLKISDISAERLSALHSGTVETTVLTECLAIDFASLMQNAFPTIGQDALQTMHEAKDLLAAQLLLASTGGQAIGSLSAHPSDTVRGWACFAIGQLESLALSERLKLIRPLADDPHFGVREWAWLGLREHISSEIDQTIQLLTPWTADPSPYIRRFACEATRPRGVWSAHIKCLKEAPEKALSILTPLRADPAPYVQDSVANWLNDAAKSRPEWVKALCADWLEASTNPATARICKRALRSFSK